MKNKDYLHIRWYYQTLGKVYFYFLYILYIYWMLCHLAKKSQIKIVHLILGGKKWFK